MFFFVWIPFTLSRFTWLIWKVDNFKFMSMHIYWFLFQILSSLSCWDIELTKSWWSALFGFGLNRSLNFCHIQRLDKIIGTLPFLVLYLKIWFHPKYWSKCHYSGIYSLWIGCSCYSTVYFPLYSRFSCYLVIMRDLTDLKKGQIVGARMAGASMTKTAELLGFSKAILSRTMSEF